MLIKEKIIIISMTKIVEKMNTVQQSETMWNMNGKIKKWYTTKTKTKRSLWGTFGAKRGGGPGITTELKFCKKW